jgi:predicted transcriptional regulator
MKKPKFNLAKSLFISRKKYNLLLDFILRQTQTTQLTGWVNLHECERENFRKIYGFTIQEVFTAYDKISDDGYIKKDHRNWDMITTKGYVFIDSGGYRGKSFRNKIVWTGKFLNVIITLIAVIIGGVYACFELFYYMHHCHP